MSSSFQLVKGLPERASLCTDVRQSLKRLYHSLICVMPLPSSPKNPLNFPNGFHFAIAKLLAKFDAIPLFESFRHFPRMPLALCIHSLTHWLHATDAVCWREKIRYARQGTLHLPTATHLRASLVSAGKNHVGYFLNSPRK
jgi:hypothetical protein